jgi:predicted anti-sigma-YlaC factor YlaD
MIGSLGTTTEAKNDLTSVTCTEARELLSGYLDDGDEVPESIKAHLATCVACRSWEQGAHELSRRLIVPAETSGGPRTARLPMPRRFWAFRLARFALAWIGVLLIAFNLPDLFARGIDVELIHLSRHQSSFSMALGTSFLFVAWRPDRAYGLVPIAAVFAIMLSGATFDLINGASTIERESIHLVEIAGLVVVWILGMSAGPGRRRKPHYDELRSAD